MAMEGKNSRIDYAVKKLNAFLTAYNHHLIESGVEMPEPELEQVKQVFMLRVRKMAEKFFSEDYPGGSWN